MAKLLRFEDNNRNAVCLAAHHITALVDFNQYTDVYFVGGGQIRVIANIDVVQRAWAEALETSVQSVEQA
jgi:recombinational DNA repair protein RecR